MGYIISEDCIPATVLDRHTSKVLVYKCESLYALKSNHSRAAFFTKRTMAAKWFKCSMSDLVCLLLPDVMNDRMINQSEIDRLKQS